MKYKIKHTKQIVYVFVALPLVLLITAAVFIALRQNLFERKYIYYSTLENATGISTQTPLLFKGFEIGRLKSYYLTDNGTIRLELSVLKKYHKLMVKDSVILRSTNPITNKTSLEYISNALSNEPLPAESIILSTDFAEGKAMLRRIAPTRGDTITEILENVAQLSSELNKDGNADKGALMRTINNIADASEKTEALMTHLETIMNQMNLFAANLNRDKNPEAGTVFRLLNNLADISASVDQQMVRVDEMLITVNRMLPNYEKPDSLLIRMLDPSGDKLFTPLGSTITNLSRNLDATLGILQHIQSSTPEMNALLYNLNETLNNAKKTLEALNNNPLLRSGITPSSPLPASPAGRISEMPDEN
ncbi:MAG: MlaD family protein [Candidatus Cloacimonadaceae bacterium]|nr:MlaD family protein [Candidatus Cloacimonadaceae bacterium]MDP3115335.1 MlaD family protein [Candidatus Cloacimonadaceae bacterium]